MLREELHTSAVEQNRKICMLFMKRPNDSFGESLQSTIKKNSEKAEQRENALKREN